ncbi:MAG: hypothetical protein EHM23_11265 [Acidobacteria bacterium]|nr:MAG: hypothetical protein EHM23_11265 [Acidobacteriota bacterium]
MGRRLLLVNVLILVGIVVLARYVTNAWREFEDTQNLGSVLGNVRPRPQASVEVPPPPEPPQAYPNFTIIAEKDLFMPERRPAPPPEDVKIEQQPKLAKNPSLNGVVNNGGVKQALITVFEGNNPKGTSRSVSVGDEVQQGYMVTEIADTSMKMRWKDADEILIDMFDASPQQQAAVPPRNARAAVTVITIGSAAAPVETTTSTEAAADEARGGLEVGVAGGQAGAGQRGQGQGVRGGNNRGNLGSDAMRGGQGGMGGTGTGTMGFPSGGSSSVPFTSGNRRRNIR